MKFIIALWNKYLLGKHIPWADINTDKNGFISISDYNYAFVKSISEKLPFEIIENKLDQQIVDLWVERYNIQRESPLLTIVHGKVLEDETIELDISWNKAFINQLHQIGFKGDSDEDIIHQYLNSISNKPNSTIDNDEPELDEDLKEELFLAAQQASSNKKS